MVVLGQDKESLSAHAILFQIGDLSQAEGEKKRVNMQTCFATRDYFTSSEKKISLTSQYQAIQSAWQPLPCML